MSDEAKAAAWTELDTAAVGHAMARTSKDSEIRKAAAQKLSEAAKAWSTATKERTHDSSAYVIPFGKSKGTPINVAGKRDLLWVAGALERSIADPEKARWKDGNTELLDAINEELETRS